jgi:hypothetical protein
VSDFKQTWDLLKVQPQTHADLQTECPPVPRIYTKLEFVDKTLPNETNSTTAADRGVHGGARMNTVFSQWKRQTQTHDEDSADRLSV